MAQNTVSAPEPDKEHDGLPISDHAPSLQWLTKAREYGVVEVTRHDEDDGVLRTFEVSVSGARD